MSPRGIFTHVGIILHILDCLGQDMQVMYLGRAPRTKETLPDFLKWRRVTRPPLVFRGLTGSQQTPGFWGVTQFVSPYPSMGQRDQCQSEGAAQAPSTSQTGHIGQSQSAGRGLGQNFQAESSGQAGQMTCYYCCKSGHMRRDCPRRQRSHGTETERSD